MYNVGPHALELHMVKGHSFLIRIQCLMYMYINVHIHVCCACILYISYIHVHVHVHCCTRVHEYYT